MRLPCIVVLLLQVACSSRRVNLGEVLPEGRGPDEGVVDWLFTHGAAGDQRARAIAVDQAGAVFVAGQDDRATPSFETESDIFLASLKRDGMLQWLQFLAAREEGSDGAPAGVFLSSPDLVTVVGHTMVNATEAVPFLADFPRGGGPAVRRDVLFGNRSCASRPCVQDGGQLLEVAVAREGVVAVGGLIQESFTSPLPWMTVPVEADAVGWGLVAVFGARGPRWGRTLGDHGVRLVSGLAFDGDGLTVAALRTERDLGVTTRHLPTLVLGAFDGVGNPTTVRTYVSDDSLQDVRIVRAQGGVVAVGRYSGTLTLGSTSLETAEEEGSELFVAGFDASLRPRWALSLGGPADSDGRGAAIAVEPTGEVMVACGGCSWPKPMAPDRDRLVRPALFKVSADGAVTAWRSLPFTGTMRVHAVEARSPHRAIVAGSFTGTFNLPDGPVSSRGGTDAFVAQVSFTR